jgi:hypothetical protein
MRAWTIGFTILAALSLLMIVIGEGVITKVIYAALLVVCVVVIALVKKKLPHKVSGCRISGADSVHAVINQLASRGVSRRSMGVTGNGR